MALTTNTRSNTDGIANFASGYIVSDAGAAALLEISLGFTPRYFQLVNLTDQITYEFYEGMASGTSVKTVAAGTRTIDTGVVTIIGTLVDITAAGMLASKSFAWVAQG